MIRGRGLPILVCAVGITGQSPAIADPLEQVTVRLEFPAGCPSRAAFDAELRRDLEGSQARGQRLQVQATIEQLGPEAWQARVKAQSDEGKSARILGARSCAALFDATSLIVAIIIDPETAATNARTIEGVTLPAPSPSPQVETATSHAAQPPASTEAAPTTPQPKDELRAALIGPIGRVQTTPAKDRRIPRYGLVAAWAAGDVGSLPATTAAFGGAIGLSYGRWRAEIAVGWWLPQDKTKGSSPNPQAGGSFGMVSGMSRLCLQVWQNSALGLGACSGLEAARRSGTANGYLANPQSTHLWNSAAAASLLGTLKWSEQLGFRLDLVVLVPFERQSFGFERDAKQIAVYELAQVAGRLGAGVEVRFP